jgi:aspartate carbamoyltransferase catalytic subunit
MIKTVTLEEYNRLRQIAVLSALLYVETKYLLDLAISVEVHMETQTTASAKVIEGAYYEVSARTKTRFQIESALEALLVQNKDLRLIVPEEETIGEAEVEVDNEPSAIPANVISIFQPRVDK